LSNLLTLRILPEGKDVQVPRGIKCINIPWGHPIDGDMPVVVAKFNNHYMSLMETLEINGTIEAIKLGCFTGARVYRDSLIFLFELAARQEFPNRRIVIGHSLGHGFFYRFADDGRPIQHEDVECMHNAITELVKKELAIIPDVISWNDAIAYMKTLPFPSAAPLVEALNNPVVKIWRCNEYLTLRHNPLVQNTRVLTAFAVTFYQDGFLLRFPPSSTPHLLGPRDDEPKLFGIYEEHKKWGRILGVSNVAQLNTLALNRERARDFIQTAEALHNRKIAELANKISLRGNQAKVVMISGPTSSGKTTFTKKLALSLKSLGLKPVHISLDDYYRERSDIPLDEEGKPDFEVLEALDIDLFNRNLDDLLAGKEAEIPIFDFKKVGGRLEKGRTMHLEDNSVLLLEGIHGLNPNLTPGMARGKTFRIYISALTQLNISDHARIPTTDNRCIRRIVRDHQFRQYPAIATLKIWPSVRRGEKRHIFPYQSSADEMFNSALDYELAILKIFAEPLLRTVNPDEEFYGEARRLMTFLENFMPFPVEEVPELSIIREFIGRSGFRY